MKVNKNIDILKYLISMMVIMIHVGYSYELPILRSAVPVFFIISSYLFFSKIQDLNNDIERKHYYYHFFKRALRLYLFWFIALLPFTIVVRGWYDMTFLNVLKEIAVGILFKSTFPASWYISAYVIGISISFYLKKYEGAAAIVGLVCYILSCLQSNYFYLFDTQWGGIPHL